MDVLCAIDIVHWNIVSLTHMLCLLLFWIYNRDSSTTTATTHFVCPQQPDLVVSFSRVHDGICDCCDGADEAAGVCEDICEELLRAAREKAARLQAAFLRGAQQRATALQDFAKMRDQTAKERQKAQADLYFTQQELERVDKLLEEAKVQVLNDRLAAVLQWTLALATTWPTPEVLVKDMGLRGWLENWSVDEIMRGIVTACQMAGEMNVVQQETSTCVPLRLAGLDRSIWWEPGTYEFVYVPEYDVQNRSQLADILDWNFHHPNNYKWSPLKQREQQRDAKGKRKKSKREHQHGRRLTEADDFDEYEAPYSDDMYLHDEDDFDEEDRLRDTKETVEEPIEEPSTSKSRREELRQAIESRSFSKSRVSFLERSKQILDVIEEFEKQKKAAEEESSKQEDGEEVVEEEKEEETSPLPVDPMAFPMIKNKLDERKKRIQRGFDFGISAQVLLEEMEKAMDVEEDFRHLLYALFVGTMNHGTLGVFHFYQILSSVLHEFWTQEDDADSNKETCQTQLTNYCPPRSIERKSVKIPPPSIFSALEDYCSTNLMDESSSSSTGTCDGGDVNLAIIPSDIPDGFAGYFELEPRNESDLFHSFFGDLGLHGNVEGRALLNEVEDELDKLEKDKSDLEKSIIEMTEKMGGENGTDFGPGGELYDLKDTCHSIEAGKYVYEACTFGSASQKEKNQKGRGTDLGRWVGASVDEETGKRVWKWENGQKCWNGPMRSATVHVTCGEENRIISADEPDTCRYVFEMESYVACDEEFRKQHGLAAEQ